MHVAHAHGEANFWLEPTVQIARNHGLSMQELNQASTIIEDNYHEICTAWSRHFSC